MLRIINTRTVDYRYVLSLYLHTSCLYELSHEIYRYVCAYVADTKQKMMSTQQKLKLH
jgi:hypothetical protein